MPSRLPRRSSDKVVGRRTGASPSRRRTRSASAPGSPSDARGASRVDEALAGDPPASLTLVLAEKPSVAADLARVLAASGKKSAGDQGFTRVGDHVITWAVGHLLELWEPDDYRPSDRRWRLENLPIWPDRFRLKPVARTRPQCAVVTRLLRSPAFREVINACDAGREGELIFRHLYEASESQLPVKRLWISAMTREAVLEGLSALRDGREYDRLAEAARCRSESDWLVGINGTRGMTVRCGVLLSVGRVQTPTLAILAEREKEVTAFVPKTYWEVHALFEGRTGNYQGTWFGPGAEDGRLGSLRRAEAIAGLTADRPGVVEDVAVKSTNRPPPLLHDLTQLQRDMNRRFGFSASKTLRVAQDLYEKHKVITYPRTDSRFLSARHIPLLKSTIEAVGRATPEFEALTAPLLDRGQPAVTGRLVNDGKVRDHHAIIPTLKAKDAGQLTGDHRKVFEAVARRFLAAFYPPAIIELKTVVTRVEGESFRTRGRTVLQAGWLAVEEGGWTGPAEEGEDQNLPELSRGLCVTTLEVRPVEKQTRPPPRYTEASLLQAMDTAGRMVDDEELQEAMKERGLGTPATRAGIIERLIEVGYVERHQRSLVVTNKGLELTALMPTRDLVSPALTGLWEARLRAVEAGEMSSQEFMAGIRELVERLVRDVTSLRVDGAAARMRRVAGPCPRCGAAVVEGAKAYACSRGKAVCGFCIWKQVAGRELRAAEVDLLLEGRKTRLLRGFRSREGRPFSAHLVLEDGKVKFIFPERESRPAPRGGSRRASRH